MYILTVDESPSNFLFEICSHRHVLLPLFIPQIFSLRSVALQPEHFHFVLIASIQKIGSFLVTTKVPAVKVSMKTTSTRSDRSAELQAADHSFSNVPIPTTTL